MSAIIGEIEGLTVSVGDGGTVYLTSEHGDLFFSPEAAHHLSECMERAARHYDADPRTGAEQVQAELDRLIAEYREVTAELEAAQQARQELERLFADLNRLDLTAAAAHRLSRILRDWDTAGAS
jgi:succinate dehydrogenase/fumarate reductase flavoprotein subunit